MFKRITRRAPGQGPQFTGFEPGACVAPTPPAAAGPASLDSPPATDHFAAVETRRVEMLNDLHAKENDLRARAADTRRQAEELNKDAIKMLASGNHTGGVAAKARVEQLLEEQRRLINIELPKLQFESASIASGNHLAMVTLNQDAQNRTTADFSAKIEGIVNNLDDARRAFDKHLARIATPETLTLAQALADASRIAKAEADYTVRTLLVARASTAAA